MQPLQVCNHPFLFEGIEQRDMLGNYDEEMMVEQCGKMQTLDKIMKHCKANKSKVLIFSQFTTMLDILEDYVRHRKWLNYCRLDGSTKWQDRHAGMDRFQTDPDCFVFLLSTKAGGLGINLTAADTVIIYDSDWNPHQDNQAQDRCHRIGQTVGVKVYRFITGNTVEMKVCRPEAVVCV